jgi:D-threo-aldose 1-dehydrogenase
MIDPRSTEQPATPRARSLGFGCAGLHSLPGRRERSAVLESAYDLGIRHFDVAPIYGLGRAEAELATFAQRHPDIRIATKFGIRPTAVGHLAGMVQPPIRRVLQSTAALKSKVKQSGATPDAGVVGRVLYARRPYSAANAERALAASLRTLRTERLEYFFLHEPVGLPANEYLDLVNYLDTQRDRGVIGHWGPAGDLSGTDDSMVAALTVRAPALQFPYDLIGGHRGPQPEQERPSITFGFLAGTLPRVTDVLGREPEFREQCSELLDADLGDARTVVKLLVRDALAHNRGGIVLLSSTKIANLEMACASADTALPNESQVAAMIRDQFIGIGAQQ